jgi:hypothetical protein
MSPVFLDVWPRRDSNFCDVRDVDCEDSKWGCRCESRDKHSRVGVQPVAISLGLPMRNHT